MDSNKRVALAACHVFLLINDYQIEAEPDLFYQRIIAWIGAHDERLVLIISDMREHLQSV